jgi:hypothetical protein
VVVAAAAVAVAAFSLYRTCTNSARLEMDWAAQVAKLLLLLLLLLPAAFTVSVAAGWLRNTGLSV